MTESVMTFPLPRWLSGSYIDLMLSLGHLPFTVDEAKRVLKADTAALLLSRLRRSGWLESVEPRTYRVVHPLVCLLEVAGWNWRSRISQRDRLPIIELAVAGIVEEFGNKLVSLVLFGSLARGDAGAESDIDILLVAEQLPASYSSRLETIRPIIHLDSIRRWREYLWEKKRVYPLIEVVALTPGEANQTHPFYLDMVEDSMMIFEKNRFMERKLGSLKERLAEIGASKIALPSGKSYWSLAENEKKARELLV
jgi:predicted nucleotidyltransferase